MKSTLDYHDGHLCILNETELDAGGPNGEVGTIREWYALREAAEAEVATLVRRPVTRVESGEGLYVDEDGEAYQLAQRGSTRPLAIETTPAEKQAPQSATDTAAAEGNGEAPAPGTSAVDLAAGSKSGNPDRIRPKALTRKLKPKKQASRGKGDSESSGSDVSSVELPFNPLNGHAVPDDRSVKVLMPNPVPLNLRQKLAEVRRRIGYVQKRGHNQRNNYSYVTAADLAGAVGDILAELGVVVVPRLESISHEPFRIGSAGGEHLTHVVMNYSFVDVDTADEITVKVAGEGLDPGDKAPYKAMTGALKYALLQSFLLATGDDPEDERPDARYSARNPERLVSAEEVQVLKTLIEETGTELERVLAYYKVASLEEMTESAYRRALEVLNRKLAKRGTRETVHAQD